ncbi:MAG: hypothetical protein P8J27_05050 [Mariniblastus sp.]|nr:hypothetical protein [Mariniblastus sp.]
MNWSLTILLANVASTLFLVGLIWMVQIVHYPLFDDVGDTNYTRYQKRHQNNITYIVGPVMLIEIATAILLAFYPIDGLSRSVIYLGIGLVVLIWLSTAFIQVPCHEKLVKGFDPDAYKRLVQSNWIRTVAWTARGVIVTWMLVRLLPK